MLTHLKSRALFYYLAATGQAHTRAHLAALLWSESGQSEAHHSLRSSLYHLRKALRAMQPKSILTSDGELLSLERTSYQCDLTEFYRLLSEGDERALSRAVAYYRGPFLQGFTIPDAPLFDDWVQVENTRLHQACFEALDRLAAWAEAQQVWEMAASYVRQMIEIDPLAETARQRLMRLYLRQGEVGLALRQYRQFERQLQRELDIMPSRETRALYEEILRLQRKHTRPAVPSAHVLAQQAHNLPFVGRDDLVQRLALLGDQVKAGRGITVLIQGEAGIGKSRLLDEFTSSLIAGVQPWMVLQGACSPFDNLLSHGPFIEALQSGAGEDLDELLVESDASVPDARGRFFWRVLQILRSLASNAPLLLVIDDLQWANSSTLNLFGFLSMRLRHLRVMLVGTVQHVEAIPALQRLITLERRRHELHLFSLAPLPRAAIEDLLRASSIDQVSVEMLAAWLHEKSGGNPFLLSEILAQVRTEGILHSAKDGWQLDATRWLRWKARFTLPETTHDLVGWRLANLPAEAHVLLDVLAVADQPLAELVLRSIPGIWNDTFPALVDDLTARGLVLELPGQARLALPHYLLRETLLHRMSNLRRRAIHRQLAEALDAQIVPGDASWQRQVALHAVAGEDSERARRYALALLAALPHEYTGAETVDFVQHLHDLLAPSASADEMVCMTRALGVLHQSLGHLDVAAHWHAQNLSWAEQAGDWPAQVEARFEMGELALMSIDYQRAAQEAEEGLAVIRRLRMAENSQVLRSLSGRGHRLLGAALAMEGRDLAAAEEHLQRAASVERQMENQADLCAVLFELGNIAAQRGDLQRALGFYDESARVAEAGRVHYYLALARNNFAYHSLLLGNLSAAQQSVAQGIKIAEAYDLLAALLHLYSTKGEIYLALQEWREADESFQNGLALAEELGSLERQAGYRGGLALAARGRKDFDAARHLLEEALALIADQGYWHLRTRLQLWLAETLFEQAHYEEAERLLEEALLVARAQQRTLLVEQGERLRERIVTVKR